MYSLLMLYVHAVLVSICVVVKETSLDTSKDPMTRKQMNASCWYRKL